MESKLKDTGPIFSSDKTKMEYEWYRAKELRRAEAIRRIASAQKTER